MKKIVYGLVFILLAATVTAANVCVVVYYPDKTADSECVDVANNANGYEVLEAASLNIEWKDWGALYGHSLCRINGVGRDVDNCFGNLGDPYWNMNLLENNKWNHAMIGFDSSGGCSVHYCAEDNDMIGFAWGTDGAMPEMLKINDIEAQVNGDKKSGADEDGGTIKDVTPGSEIKLEIEIENLYSEETNIELTDVIAKGIINGIDDGDDIEEESDEENIRAEDTEIIELEFEIPLEVKDKSYDLELTIEGKDEKGIKYRQVVDFKVDVEKDKHDVVIKAELTNPILKCSRTTGLNLNLVNMGTNDEDVVLNIINDELELNEQLSFKLDDNPFDSDSKYTNSVIIAADKEQEASIYPIRVRADYSSKTTEKTVELEIQDCDGAIEEITGQTTNQQKPTVKKSDSDSIYSNSRFVAVFLMGLFIAIIFGGLLIAKMFGHTIF